MSVIKQISDGGTSIWLDDLSRSKISGLDPHSLPYRIAHDGVVGVTTNPSIFSGAISKGAEYAGDIASMSQLGAEAVIQKLTTDDVRSACDLFTSIHASSEGVDGRVSIEVDPRSARHTQATIDEGRALWKLVDRPNLLIKVPATKEGLPAITQLISEGISVNVTLIFSVTRYAEVIDAYISGLEKAEQNGKDLSQISSVASFFISRIDTSIDALLKQVSTPQSLSLLGKVAIANAAIAYETFESKRSSSRWLHLAQLGAKMQRPLWASTGVKDPSYDDTRYVMELIAPDTVNTMPQATLDAVLDHGNYSGVSLNQTFANAHTVMAQLNQCEISLDEVTDALEIDGVFKFAQSWEELITNVSKALTQ